ncbi:MAG: D-sedoheptulose 7-phosphate isomerase [Candidatus Omnitrophica bacterium]|nr:D-sedoheptulose 7-phosphate isomerase [Candidatus Omnitrophota bacterium]
MNKIITESLNQHREAVAFLESNCQLLEKIAGIFIETLKQKGKVIFMGNGGSAADAQHLAAELIGRFKLNRAPLAALALSTNTSTITAVGNDFGFKEVFARQVEALTEARDCIVGISTSGKSENVIIAIKKAKEIGAKTIGFLGKDGGDLAKIVDLPLIVSVNDTPRIQEMHLLAGHIICEIVEKELC